MRQKKKLVLLPRDMMRTFGEKCLIIKLCVCVCMCVLLEKVEEINDHTGEEKHVIGIYLGEQE